MPGYISSNENRFYVSAEPAYGAAAAITAGNRIPAVQLKVSQQSDIRARKDKTGSRTYVGAPSAVRRTTKYDLSTYLTEWSNTAAAPAYGPLFEAAMGGSVKLYGGGASPQAAGSILKFTQPHGLQFGQGIAAGGEIRFVAGVADSQTVALNAPFSTTGLAVGPTATYAPATELKSFSLFDYWSPDTAVQRILCGSGVDRMRVKVNADYQVFEFSGASADVVDSSSFSAGEAAMQQFPAEPAAADFTHTIVPGHLGQVWMGGVPGQFFTLTAAEITLENVLALRSMEFGSALSRGLNGGLRNANLQFTVFAQDDAATPALYQAARQRSPIGLMFQLGEQPGQLCGIYMPAVTLETPQFEDTSTRLQWTFTARAQGSADDELFVAFA
jgi:hypothetical protein